MAYHDDLLSQALQLLHAIPQTQASLRRAVSAAYYAVFHFLIAEATSHWDNVKLRPALGRAYEHGVMKAASNRLLNTRAFPFAGEDPKVVAALRLTAVIFTQLQEARHFADYGLTRDLTFKDALGQVESAEEIFRIWPTIADEPIAQEYLVSLVVKQR
jgi:uncharacterized protein (UPF0332 family)